MSSEFTPSLQAALNVLASCVWTAVFNDVSQLGRTASRPHKLRRLHISYLFLHHDPSYRISVFFRWEIMRVAASSLFTIVSLAAPPSDSAVASLAASVLVINLFCRSLFVCCFSPSRPPPPTFCCLLFLLQRSPLHSHGRHSGLTLLLPPLIANSFSPPPSPTHPHRKRYGVHFCMRLMSYVKILANNRLTVW